MNCTTLFTFIKLNFAPLFHTIHFLILLFELVKQFEILPFHQPNDRKVDFSYYSHSVSDRFWPPCQNLCTVIWPNRITPGATLRRYRSSVLRTHSTTFLLMLTHNIYISGTSCTGNVIRHNLWTFKNAPRPVAHSLVICLSRIQKSALTGLLCRLSNNVLPICNIHLVQINIDLKVMYVL